MAGVCLQNAGGTVPINLNLHRIALTLCSTPDIDMHVNIIRLVAAASTSTLHSRKGPGGEDRGVWAARIFALPCAIIAWPRCSESGSLP